MKKKIEECVSFIRSQSSFKPDIAIILGSGLSQMAEKVTVSTILNYGNLPFFPIPTVIGHPGKLIMGTIGNHNVAIMQGRFHYYEGYSMQEVVFPVRALKYLGVNTLFVSNAAGGLNPLYKSGDLMVISDHINLTGDNPLRGPNDNTMGPRFPNQTNLYDEPLIEKAIQIASSNNIPCHKGVYAGVSGPALETPAEYKYLRIIGGDAVGMSTVPEVIAANHMGMKVFGVSVITNQSSHDSAASVNHEEVLKAAAAAEPNLATLLTELVNSL